MIKKPPVALCDRDRWRAIVHQFITIRDTAQQHHDVRSDRPTLADRVALLGSLRLDAHRSLREHRPAARQNLAHPRHDRWLVLRQLDGLEVNRRIDVFDTVACGGDPTRGFLGEEVTRLTLPACVGVGKELADISPADGAEQRVGERVKQNVAVTVSDRTHRRWDLDAADPQRQVRLETMSVGAESDAKHSRDYSGPRREAGRFFGLSEADARREPSRDPRSTASGFPLTPAEHQFRDTLVARQGDLDIVPRSLDETGVHADALEQSDLVGLLLVTVARKHGVGVSEVLAARPLRCLHLPDSATLQVAPGQSVLLPLDTVCRRVTDHGGAVITDGGEDPSNVVDPDQRSRGVVDEPDIKVLPEALETDANRVLAPRSAGDDLDSHRGARYLSRLHPAPHEPLDSLDVVTGRHDDDALDLIDRAEDVQRPEEHRPTGQLEKLLLAAALDAEACAAAGRRNDDTTARCHARVRHQNRELPVPAFASLPKTILPAFVCRALRTATVTS